MILTNVRLNWIKFPNDAGKYSICILVPKNSTSATNLLAAAAAAKESGINRKKFTKAQANSSNFKAGIRDGDIEAAEETQPADYKGHWFINLSNINPPGVVYANNVPANYNILYPGCYGHVDVDIYPFYNQKENARGITGSINNIMFVRDGDRLDGRPPAQSATDAFADFATDTPDESSSSEG